MNLRLAEPADVPMIRRLFYAAMPLPPAQERWREGHAEWFRRRLEQAIALDPEGVWVGEDDAGLAGVACAHVREGIWVLTLLAVHPGAQGGGLGRALFDRALAYGAEARGWLIAASEDARGWRLYAGAGFHLHPCVEADGPVRRELIPAVAGVREGSAADLGRCAEIDRRVRGGARTPDLELLLGLEDARLFLTDRGYAMTLPERLLMLAAEHEAEAEALLWSCLAGNGPGGTYSLSWITGAQQWAIRVAHAARLPLRPEGPYLTRGELGPLRPWLPHGAYL